MNMVESLKDKADGMLSSANQINRVVVDKLEAGTRLNLDAAGYYSNVGIKQLRAFSNIRDLDSIQKFTADSISQGGEVIKRMLDDSKTWMNLVGDTREELANALKSQAENAAERASGSMQAATNEAGDMSETKKRSPGKSAMS